MARQKHDADAPAPAEAVTPGATVLTDENGRRPDGKFGPGNPGGTGRPKRIKELREKIQERGEDLIQALFDIVDELPKWAEEGMGIVGPLHKDRIAAATKLLEYGYGKPAQSISLTGADGGPVQVVTGETSDEKRKRLAALTALAVARAAGGTSDPGHK